VSDAARTHARYVTAIQDADEAGPEDFLAAAQETPRGFWSHGAAWSAFAGALAVVRAGGGRDRFREVRRVADRVLAAPDDRLYGGFAFGDALSHAAEWASFGSGSFVLPAIEFRQDEAGWSCVSRGATPESATRQRESVLHRMRTGGGAVCPPPTRVDAVTGSDAAAWASGIEAILRGIREREIIKVVLARTLDISTDADPLFVLRRLRQENPASTVFYFEPSPGVVVVGAAPEVVVLLEGEQFRTTAVAGSIPRGQTPDEDERLAQQLVGSSKDRAEHAIGVQETVRRLSRFAKDVHVEAAPHVLQLARIQHLETRISTAVAPGKHVLEILEALHPTAAVCGYPRERALAYLRELEGFERGWYAGPVGWFDGRGDGTFAPALRSGVLHQGRWRLYAGAGIVVGSDADREWEETSIKFEPMLHALQAPSVT